MGVSFVAASTGGLFLGPGKSAIVDRFTLIVQSEQLKRPCHIVWRKEKRMGVAFD